MSLTWLNQQTKRLAGGKMLWLFCQFFCLQVKDFDIFSCMFKLLCAVDGLYRGNQIRVKLFKGVILLFCFVLIFWTYLPFFGRSYLLLLNYKLFIKNTTHSCFCIHLCSAIFIEFSWLINSLQDNASNFCICKHFAVMRLMWFFVILYYWA